MTLRHSIQGLRHSILFAFKGCGGKLVKSSGTFTSPGYPSNYPVATDCVWEIETEPGSRVQLNINDLDIESSTGCQYDFLEVNLIALLASLRDGNVFLFVI